MDFTHYYFGMKLSPSSSSFLDRYFSFISRRSPFDVFLFNIALVCVIGSGLYLLIVINAQYITSVPSSGGTIVEGIVGTPRFVNPVLALTRADQDMVELVFSGLMKLDESGNLVPDIAESITRSEDGRTYAVKLQQGIRFHNGTEVTSKDIAYTIGLIQNPDLKSPLRGNWDGVVIEEVDNYNLTIKLEEAYTPFIENLLVGILPRDLWSELPIEQIPFSQNNTEPIGSGPYQVSDVLRTPSGLISAYQLSSFDSSARAKPNITTLVFNFYQNEDQLLTALKARQISGTPSLSTKNLAALAEDDYRIIEEPLPRTFGIYINQNRIVALRDQSARHALSVAIDRTALVESALDGFGIPITSPVPPGFIEVELENTDASTTPPVDGTEQARTILLAGGWVQNENGNWTKKVGDENVTLAVTLTTANADVFTTTAEFVVEAWKKLGVEVTLIQFEQTDLVQNIIRPRDFEAVLYGADIGRSIDLFPFWHSSQKNDPGLNIAQYTNIDADALLEKIRNETDTTLRNEAIRSFERIMKSEYPAIFLYTPTFGYVVDTDVNISQLLKISRPSERFANVHTWHVRSNNVWPVFSSQNSLNN